MGRKGRIRHADHATIALHGWHRVLMNTEGQSKAMKNVAFWIDAPAWSKRNNRPLPEGGFRSPACVKQPA
jgi:hypothetical protein